MAHQDLLLFSLKGREDSQLPAGVGRSCVGDTYSRQSTGKTTADQMGGGLVMSNLNWRSAYICGNSPTPQAEGYNS